VRSSCGSVDQVVAPPPCCRAHCSERDVERIATPGCCALSVLCDCCALWLWCPWTTIRAICSLAGARPMSGGCCPRAFRWSQWSWSCCWCVQASLTVSRGCAPALSSPTPSRVAPLSSDPRRESPIPYRNVVVVLLTLLRCLYAGLCCSSVDAVRPGRLAYCCERDVEGEERRTTYLGAGRCSHDLNADARNDTVPQLCGVLSATKYPATNRAIVVEATPCV
jgi:hypothetical protein